MQLNNISVNIANLYHITISIDLYKNYNLRNLQSSIIRNKQLDLYIDENTNIEPGKIIKLKSKKEFDETDRIVVSQIKNNEYQTKVLNNDNKILDTKENSNMIKNNKIFDLSKDNLKRANIYKINSVSSGCEFDLTSDAQINQESQNFSLKFIENSNNNNAINEVCNLQKNNNNKIPCSLEEHVNQNYKLDSSTFSNEQNEIFTISPIYDEKSFKLCCENNDINGINRINLGMIIIICGVLFLVIAFTIIIVVICCKKERVNKIYNTQMKRDDIYSNDSFSEKESYNNWKRKKKKYYK